MNQTIKYVGREIPLLGYWDTVIIGGGSAGATAGIASARGGNSTLIVDKCIRLGGTSTNALVTPMMKSFTGHHSIFFEIEQMLTDLGENTRDCVKMGNLWFTPELLVEVLETLYTEAGGEVLYDAAFCDCVLENGKLRYLIFSAVDGLCAVAGGNFVDASGDAVLVRSAGVPYAHGDEEGYNQLSSLRFEMGGVDIARYRDYLLSIGDDRGCLGKNYFYEASMVGGDGWALEPLFRKAVADGVLEEEDLHYFQGFVMPSKPNSITFNCPHLVALKDNTHAMDRSRNILRGRKMIRRLVRFLRGYVPGFENAYLQQEASMLGVRESFRLCGKYELTENAYSDRARFADGVARGDWLIDIHTATKGLYHRDVYQHGDYYDIPYRSMICDQVENLVVAGRCISASFRMQASVRITPTCIDMGQAAGEACVYARQNGIPLNAIDGAVLCQRLPYQERLL